jgi:hypothetical protein
LSCRVTLLHLLVGRVPQVLQHDSSTAASISNEVDLVMSFRHENIVRAYYFITWTRSTPQQDTRAVDQFSSFDSVSTATTMLSPARLPQPISPPALLSKGAQLAPVVETPSGTKPSSAGQSSATASAAASVASLAAGPLSSGSNVILSAGSAGHSTTIRVSIGGLDQLGDQGLKVLTSSKPTSSRGVSVNIGSYNNSANNSANTSSAGGAVSGHNSDSNAAGAAVAAPAGLNNAALRASFESSVALARVQQQQRQAQEQQRQAQPQQPVQQMPSFVPMVRAPSSVSIESASSAWRSGRVPAAAVQLVPLTDTLQRACSPQQEYVGGDSLSANYAVSGAHTSGRSAGGLRNAAAPSSFSTAGTSSSLLPMALSSQQLQQDLPRQPAADNVNLQDQLGAQDGVHPQAQRYAQLMPASSPSPLAKSTATASFSVSQSQSVWLQNTASSSGGGSGNKPASKGRSTDEAQTWLIFEYCDGSTLLDLLAPDGPLGPHLTGHSRLVRTSPCFEDYRQ